MRRLWFVIVVACAHPELRVATEPAPPPIEHGEVGEVGQDMWQLADPWDAAPSEPVPSRPPQPARPPVAALPQVIPLTVTKQHSAKPAAAPLIPAPHQLEIRRLAVTDDARVAVTTDGQGVRLWPSLDGRHEPVVVTMRAMHALAITRSNDELAIAGIDEIGQLELVRAAASGEVRDRRHVALRRPLVSIAGTPHGFVGLHDDRSITLLAADGMLRGELVAEPGHYVASVVVRGERALALVESEHKLRGRWLDIEAVRWGASTAVLPIDAAHAVLSADHRRLAGAFVRDDGIAIVELATGKVIARPAPENGMPAPGDRVLGYIDSGALAVIRDNQLWWWHGAKLTPGDDAFVSVGVAAGSTLIAASSASLAISSPRRTSYVGYRTAWLQFEPTATGFLAFDHASVCVLDASFVPRTVQEIIDPAHGGGTPRFAIDHRHLIGEVADGMYIIDLERGEALLAAQPGFPRLFERSTGLIASIQRDGIDLFKWNSSLGKVSAPIRIPSSARTQRVSQVQPVLLDPARFAGNSVVLITLDQDLLATATFFRVTGDVLPQLEQTEVRTKQLWERWFHSHELRDAFLPKPQRPRRSPDRKLVAQLRDERLVLRDAKGHERWSVPVFGATDVMWNRHGELFVTGGGIARVDLATGALRERRCGWQFGKWDAAEGRLGGAALCQAP